MILAVISRKGGVGKTTTVVSLAGALARLGQKILVVDLDSQASASISLGISRGDLAPSIHDVLFKNLPVARAVRPTFTKGIDLITASADLLYADVDLANLRNRESRLRDALAPVAAAYDWVLLDCPPAFNTLAQNAIIACDQFLVPAVPHFLAFDGIGPLLEAAGRLAQRYGKPPGFLGVLLTMVDNRTKSARVQATELREKLGDLVFDSEVPTNVRLAEAPATGQTIFEWFPQAAGAHAYRLAAVELLHRTGKTIETPEAEAPAAALAPSAPDPDREPVAPPTPLPSEAASAAEEAQIVVSGPIN
jgi:chromosome partitioning protein